MCESVRRKLGHTNASLSAHVQHWTAFSRSSLVVLCTTFISLIAEKEGINEKCKSLKINKRGQDTKFVNISNKIKEEGGFLKQINKQGEENLREKGEKGNIKKTNKRDPSCIR